jgi:hypothetical protein
MASTDHQQDFGFDGKPSAASSVKNKFDGVGNPNQGEQSDLSPNLAPNKFPRQGGSDSAGPFAGGDFAG